MLSVPANVTKIEDPEKSAKFKVFQAHQDVCQHKGASLHQTA
jgi:hypothetical protein